MKLDPERQIEKRYRLDVEVDVTPEHLNRGGILHGGNLVKFMDEAGGDLALLFALTHCVTVHMDSVKFYKPVFAGQTILLRTAINRVWGTSLEVGVRAEVIDGEESTHVASGYFVYVSVVEENGVLHKVHMKRKYDPRTDEDKRRWREAGARRKRRLRERGKKKP